MANNDRRQFLAKSGKLIIGGVALTSFSAYASQHGEHAHGGAGDGIAVDASTQDICGTCQYWGGMRKVSSDKARVIAQSMGWCNNPDSANYQKLTTADHQMKKTGIWEKWAVL